MRVELCEAGPDQRPLLENLLQFYLYDFSEIMGADVPNEGRFQYSLADLPNPKLRAFILKVQGSIAGFALVSRGSVVTGDPDVTDMAEFFVMRKYRRKRVGSDAAQRIFSMFPGRWEVRQMAANVAAQAFWRSVIGEYTDGAFEERTLNAGPMQTFVSRPSDIRA